MAGVNAWYVISAISFLLIALLMRFSTCALPVHQCRWLPELSSSALHAPIKSPGIQDSSPALSLNKKNGRFATIKTDTTCDQKFKKARLT